MVVIRFMLRLTCLKTNFIVVTTLLYLLIPRVYAEGINRYYDSAILENIPVETKDENKKKCMTVCKKWGENCIINPRTGVRKCMRVCNSFKKECF